MSNTVAEHPTEQELIAFAIDGAGDEAQNHIRECPSCARFVKEVHLAQGAVREIPDEQIPADLQRRILSHAEVRTSPRPGMWGKLGEWYRNPLLIGLGVALAAVFFYVFFVFVL
ncbi:MAG: hypothetical protein GF331_08170 [Chitinivibrionales bacterium]|nr:hypothetical protein [Chitinivibrionales bacterium]